MSQRDIGKTILAACFVTDLGTVLALGVLFADFTSCRVGPAGSPSRSPAGVSEPEIKFLFLVLFMFGGLASEANSEAVLPAYLVRLAVAGAFVRDRVLVHRMRAIAFSLLTPFSFIKAGLFVALPAVIGGAGPIGALLAVKVGAKVAGVWPTARAFGMPVREANYTTLLMSTGLTFGTISTLFGLTHAIIDEAADTILVTVVVLSAMVPTFVATTFFQPVTLAEVELEEIEAADEIDSCALPRPRPRSDPA